MTIPSMHQDLTSDQATSPGAEAAAIACPSCGRATAVVSGYIAPHPTYTSIYCLASDLQAPLRDLDVRS